MKVYQKGIDFTEQHVKFSDDATKGVFEGYASVFNITDLDGDIIAPGAFKSALRDKTTPSMHFNHQRYEIPIGKWLSLEEDSRGLYVKGELTPNHSMSDDIKAAMLHGTVRGMSVGMLVDSSGLEALPSGGLLFRSIKILREISLCTLPANEEAQVVSIKSIDGVESIRDIENWLRDAAGLSRGDAQTLISRIKSSVSRDSSDASVAAIAQQIKSFKLL